MGRQNLTDVYFLSLTILLSSEITHESDTGLFTLYKFIPYQHNYSVAGHVSKTVMYKAKPGSFPSI